MPLKHPVNRRELHSRLIEMQTYLRDDGLYDVEASLVDRKPFAFLRASSPTPVPAGQPLHDLWLRLTLDDDYVVKFIEASSDVTPWEICKEAEQTLSVLIGERVARGWSSIVKERLRGASGCTHLTEMLIPMATTALQGIRGLHQERTQTTNAEGVPHKINSCYAYGHQREVVKMLWPEHHRPAKDN